MEDNKFSSPQQSSLRKSSGSTAATPFPHHTKLQLSREDSIPKIVIPDHKKEIKDLPKKQSSDHHQPLLKDIKINIDDQDEKKKALLWACLAAYIPDDKTTLQREFVRHIEYTLAQTRNENSKFSSFQSLAYCTRDRLIERWKDTRLFFQQQQVKQVNYLSLEFLLGRSLQNSLLSLGLVGKYGEALMDLGIEMENLYEEERDAGLGNGGLGRLASCLMDSLATMDYPACGYGLRYNYGMFYQKIIDGQQVELPDYWLNYGSPWQVERLDLSYNVGFYGTVKESSTTAGNNKSMEWEPSESVLAVAYDHPVPGYNTFNTINIRLWSSKPSDEFDLASFNQGNYLGSIEDKVRSENITNVLYPNDNTMQGKELRLKQQYFFVSATLQDIISQFKQTKKPFKDFPSFHAIQLNDTHPTLGIPELMRLLIDVENLSWEEAWDITTRTFSYTNHTVLPEALERWSVPLVEYLIPRHIRIIYDINQQFLQLVEKKWPGDNEKKRILSIIDESDGKHIRMAHLAIVGSHMVNGVAKLHTELIKKEVFPLFYELWPDKFVNMTNGVTPRRWIYQCNPELSSLITKTLNTSRWVVNLDIIGDLKKFANDSSFQKEWIAIKRSNKVRMAEYIEKRCGIRVSVDAMFDTHVKRFHEYKRQLLNILGVINRYLDIKAGQKLTPRVIIFAGKAAPGYYMAKKIIKLINSVADVVNNDPVVGDRLKIVFIPNYCVSNAEIIIPSSDLSQHISTAGTEASGTSNMKFSMNGSLILGTLDGANIEIREEIGEENMFIFGATADKVDSIRKLIQQGTLTPDKRWVRVITAIEEGTFGDVEQFQPILDSITKGRDHYILSYDFTSYMDIQNTIDKCYENEKQWAKMSILASAGCGTFSSDRTIKEYSNIIWKLDRCRRKGPIEITNQEATSFLSSVSGGGGGGSSNNSLSGCGSLGNSEVNQISIERLSPLTVIKQPQAAGSGGSGGGGGGGGLSGTSPLVVINKNDVKNAPKPAMTTHGFDIK